MAKTGFSDFLSRIAEKAREIETRDDVQALKEKAGVVAQQVGDKATDLLGSVTQKLEDAGVARFESEKAKLKEDSQDTEEVVEAVLLDDEGNEIK